jgi:hypothetical protein
MPPLAELGLKLHALPPLSRCRGVPARGTADLPSLDLEVSPVRRGRADRQLGSAPSPSGMAELSQNRPLRRPRRSRHPHPRSHSRSKCRIRDHVPLGRLIIFDRKRVVTIGQTRTARPRTQGRVSDERRHIPVRIVGTGPIAPDQSRPTIWPARSSNRLVEDAPEELREWSVSHNHARIARQFAPVRHGRKGRLSHRAGVGRRRNWLVRA